MTTLKTAKRELAKWRNRWLKEYKYRRHTWSFPAIQAANQCKRWREEIERIKNA